MQSCVNYEYISSKFRKRTEGNYEIFQGKFEKIQIKPYDNFKKNLISEY